MKRLLFLFVKLLFLFVLPFWLLIRGSVYLHEQYVLSAWSAIGGGVLLSAALIFLYLAYLRRIWLGRTFGLRRTYALALALVVVYCLPCLFFLSATNAKHESVREEFTRLHPVLRLGVSTVIFLDQSLLITDADRRPEDYGRMGLPVNNRSLHYRQSSGYAHAVDIRTIGRGPIRNGLLSLYFRLMGFQTLRHTGTADHLHVSLYSHDRPGGR